MNVGFGEPIGTTWVKRQCIPHTFVPCLFVAATLCSPNPGPGGEGQQVPERGAAGWHPCDARFVGDGNGFGLPSHGRATLWLPSLGFETL